jgi:hypothetical protein
MATDFTVIVRVRGHLGDDENYFKDVEPSLPPVEPRKDYPFDCPNVDPGQEAVLMFQTRDVDNNKSRFRINGVDVKGGIPVSPSKDTWNGNIMLIARGVLGETNHLVIEARDDAGGYSGDRDDFIIDNVVVFYKTR